MNVWEILNGVHLRKRKLDMLHIEIIRIIVGPGIFKSLCLDPSSYGMIVVARTEGLSRLVWFGIPVELDDSLDDEECQICIK